MKVRSKFLEHLHLDKNYHVLPGKSTKLLLDYFKALDMHRTGGLNDIQFYHMMKVMTDLNKTQIYLVFDMLDTDSSGEIDFNEFYLLMCIIIAVKDKDEKQFIHRHSRTVFDLLDEDGSNSISATEFELHGFLFGFQNDAISKIFHDFDVSGDQELDFKEFRMFAMACIDKQEELARLKERQSKSRWLKDFFRSFMAAPPTKANRRLTLLGALEDENAGATQIRQGVSRTVHRGSSRNVHQGTS